MSAAGASTRPASNTLHSFRRAAGARAHIIALTLGIVLAAGLRVYDIGDTFVGLLPVREFRAALIARDQYYALGGAASTQEREVARISREREWSLEPPVMEAITAGIYRVTGGERLWIPRLLATLFFLGSAFFLWQIAHHLFDRATAGYLTIGYAFVPVGVIASKSFQPDTLMLLLYLGSLWALLRYDREPSWRRLLPLALAAAAAIHLRPLCVFPIAGAAAGLAGYRIMQGRSYPVTHALAFGGALLAGTSFYVHGLLGDRLAGQAGITFRPHLIRMREYWQGWLVTGLDTITIAGALAALAGLFFVRSARLAAVLAGLWVSYVAFGLIFNYHIATHNYYHLQVLPTVALSAGSLVALLLRRAQSLERPALATAGMYAVLAVFVLMSAARVIRHGAGAQRFEAPQLAAEVGELVRHSSSVVYLAPFYGRPLEYFGRLSGAYWPRPTTRGIYDPDGTVDASVDDRLRALPFEPEYFVITDFREYTRHHDDLAAWLAEHCTRLSNDERFLVFGRCAPGMAGFAGERD